MATIKSAIKKATTPRRRLKERMPISESKTAKPDRSESYNEFKQFDGQQYTGMTIGRSHKWYYDKGEWKETKITPDLWQISYEVTKRRAGKAPEGSGVPVGTAYHWFILAHQNVKKLNANDYTTSMTGLKYKLSHKRATKEKWSSTTKTQRKHLINFLKEIIDGLEKDPMVSEFEFKEKTYRLEASPIAQTCFEEGCMQFEVSLDGEHIGIIQRLKNSWKLEKLKDKKLVNAIGKEILQWYK
ncbi:hypothetical protein [Chryseolinea sp. H1M3-3]|uniref:hypothetical protein n=1 Tax=Chryseolinea sp. H1M3-3 TaxID=3034144 RepID=UPI0023EC2E78|nr:hypothetical protein [Chryseolinea sp. H1M3-3]